ncbi:GerAB/ArcD/ProY family transporter [Paenibacillus radicis (ex Xue et al. 2023)]|uniref:Endospore germination permease n=1 Tax=Paenibacillus radicis (ex Xue et al. 2023) TaxID=2972489 RepID=A0ABT1YKL3_9BACL|nr:endospore germination permease [Paenibacillus radicis (ex Xue et al. 2023)]MCR8632788.1 endospore germination permease [Paenibacillus radicis (ex Xue et al. 2023)]
MEQISTKQMSVLIIFFVIGDMLLFLPSNMAAITHQDAWISGLIGLVIGLLFAWLIFEFSQCFPGMNLVQIHKQVLGTWVGGAVSLFYMLVMFHDAATQVREIGDFVTTQMMTETPMRIICILMVIMLVVAIRSGLESIARTAEVLILVFAIMFIAIILLLIPEAKLDRLTPVLEHDIPTLVHGSLFFIAFPFTELFVMWMILPNVKANEHLRKDFILASVIGGIAIFAIVLLSLLVLGAYLTEHQMYSTYTLAKKIGIGHFLERVEAILAISWLLCTYFRMVIYGYGFIKGIAELLQIQNYRYLTIPFGTLTFSYALLIAPNVVYFDSMNPYWVTWDFTYFPVIPLIVYLIFKIRQRAMRR